MSRYVFWRFFVVGIMGAITMFFVAIVEIFWPSLNFLYIIFTLIGLRFYKQLFIGLFPHTY